MNFKLKIDITKPSASCNDRRTYFQVSYSLNFGYSYKSLYNTASYVIEDGVKACKDVIDKRNFTDKKSVIAYVRLKNKELYEFLKGNSIQLV